MRIVEDRFPGQGSGAESRNVVGQVPDLLGVAIGATLPGVNGASPLFAGGKGQWMIGRCAVDLLFEDTAGPNTEQQDRHRKESQPGHAGNQV
jgi:hypothetical protein